MGDICHYIMSFLYVLRVTYDIFPSVLSAIYVTQFVILFFKLVDALHKKVKGISHDNTGNQVGTEVYTQNVCTELSVIFWPFYIQIGSKHDGACIWGGILYHFSNLKKFLSCNWPVLITKWCKSKWYWYTIFAQWLADIVRFFCGKYFN